MVVLNLINKSRVGSAPVFNQLRILAKLKPFLNRTNLEKTIHAFISSRLDHCNALYVGVSETLFKHLQLVQNAAAHFLTIQDDTTSPQCFILYTGFQFLLEFVLKCSPLF